jgi:hypothetical protein
MAAIAGRSDPHGRSAVDGRGSWGRRRAPGGWALDGMSGAETTAIAPAQATGRSSALQAWRAAGGWHRWSPCRGRSSRAAGAGRGWQQSCASQPARRRPGSPACRSCSRGRSRCGHRLSCRDRRARSPAAEQPPAARARRPGAGAGGRASTRPAARRGARTEHLLGGFGRAIRCRSRRPERPQHRPLGLGRGERPGSTSRR